VRVGDNHVVTDLGDFAIDLHIASDSFIVDIVAGDFCFGPHIMFPGYGGIALLTRCHTNLTRLIRPALSLMAFSAWFFVFDLQEIALKRLTV
jgi:hypothetical protein